MVEVGATIEATVTRVEPYGVFLKYGDDEVVVLVPEVSWSDHRPLQERIHVGDAQKVFVLRFNYQQKQIVGSMRRLLFDENPYRQLSKLEPGAVLRGRVVFVTDSGAMVELPNHAQGFLPGRDGARARGRGDEVDVVISSLEVDEGNMKLELASQDDATSSRRQGIAI